jgi:hypothetical protein
LVALSHSSAIKTLGIAVANNKAKQKLNTNDLFLFTCCSFFNSVLIKHVWFSLLTKEHAESFRFTPSVDFLLNVFPTREEMP